MSCVYFIRHKTTTPIKIGMSSKDTPEDRVKAMETGSPYGIEILGFIITNTAEDLESTLHKKYSKHRLHGEWFDIAEEEVKSVLREHSVSNANSLQMLRAFLVKEKLTPKSVMDIVKWHKQYNKEKELPPSVKELKDTTSEKELLDYYHQDLSTGYIREHYDTGYYKKADWIHRISRSRNKSRATVYRLYEKHSHLFEEVKDGKVSLFRLKEMEV